MDRTKARRAMWARCTKCAHKWIVVYLPIELTRFCAAVQTAHCPMCGSTVRAHEHTLGSATRVGRPLRQMTSALAHRI